MTKQVIFTGENISKSYDRMKTYVVENLDFEVRKGEFLGIVGESGSGKSTLAKMMTLMTPISHGEMKFKGANLGCLSGKNKKNYHACVQMVFQDPLSSFSPKMRIEAYLMEPLRNFKKIDKGTARKSIEEALSWVQLPLSYLEKYPHQMSGGELQRVVIARAVMIQPEILICDEATSALDVTIQKDIMALIESLRKLLGFSVVFITHDIALACERSDRIYVMQSGRVVEHLEKEAFMESAVHPYTQKLFECATSLDLVRQNAIGKIEQSV